MSRRSRRRRSESNVPNATPLSSLAPLSRAYYSPLRLDLDRLAPPANLDRRVHHPLGEYRPAVAFSGHPVRTNVVRPSKFKSNLYVSPKVRFAVPKKTLICVRRAERKEVLHALKKVGRGRGGGRKRRNWFSEVTC